MRENYQYKLEFKALLDKTSNQENRDLQAKLKKEKYLNCHRKV